MKITPDMVVFVTGGASGLGEATIRSLHAQGCKIAIADMNVERLEMIKKELKERILVFECDVTKEEDVKKAINETAAKWGTIHVVLPCAGLSLPSLTLSSKNQLDINKFKKVVDINLMGTIYVVKYASILMAKNKPVNDRGEKGVIIFVSSVAAEEGQRG